MRRFASAAGSLLVILTLLLGACAPGALTPAPTPRPAPPPAVAPTPKLTPMPAPPAEKPAHGGILYLAAGAGPADFDAHQSRTYAVQNPLAPINNWLVRGDPQDGSKLIPDLAERWEVSPDAKTYTFYLRRGVKFHDGKPFTAADVKASFDRMAWPPKGTFSPRQALFASLEKIETTDDSTVRFWLKNPQASFLGVLAAPFHFIFPRHILAAKGDMKKDAIGTGPFKFKEYIRGVSFEVVKNPDYFRPGLPYLDGVMRYIIPDTAAMHSAFRTKRVHLIHSPSYSFKGLLLERLLKEYPDVVGQPLVLQARNYVVPNLGRKPWDDRQVRQALHLALDRQAAIKLVFEGEADVGGSVRPGPWAIPAEELLKRPGYRQPKEQDLAEARKLLAEAGLAKGLKPKLIIRSDSKTYLDVAVFIKDQLAKVGIEAEVQLMEYAAAYERLFTHNFDLTGVGANAALDDPDAFLGETYLSDSLGNYGQYRNPRIDELYLQQTAALDPQRRKEILLEMQEIIEKDQPYPMLFWRRMTATFWREVRNWNGTPAGANHPDNYDTVWLAR